MADLTVLGESIKSALGAVVTGVAVSRGELTLDVAPADILKVMAHLRDIDDVAYVRFASVYRNFGEVKDFRAALDELSGDEDAPVVPPARK